MKYLSKFGTLIVILILNFLLLASVLGYGIYSGIRSTQVNVSRPMSPYFVDRISNSETLVTHIKEYTNISTNKVYYDLDLIYNAENTVTMIPDYIEPNETRDYLYSNIQFLSDKFDEILLSTNMDKFDKETGLMSVYSELLNLSQIATNMTLMDTDYQLRNYYDAVLDEVSRILK